MNGLNSNQPGNKVVAMTVTNTPTIAAATVERRSVFVLNISVLPSVMRQLLRSGHSGGFKRPDYGGSNRPLAVVSTFEFGAAVVF